MSPVALLRCTACGAEYPPGQPPDVCGRHEGLEGILEVCYAEPHETTTLVRGDVPLAAQDTLVRYRALLPLSERTLASVPEGWLRPTPVVDAPQMAEALGVARLMVKDDGRNPTGSLKDRSSTLGALHALELGMSDICCASTGNAASSLAGICANLGLRAHIFVPESTPQAKLDQLQVFGAQVLLVRGSYDDAYYLSRDVAAEFGWYDRNCATNPYLVEGKKTCGLELAEQLADDPVDWVSVAVGDGCTVTAIHKGLREMQRLGVIRAVPRILAVQPEGAAPIAEAFRRGEDEVMPVVARSTADSISVGRPRNAFRALDAVRTSGGAFATVSDESMSHWRERLAGLSGVFAEAGAAAGVAGVAEARRSGLLGPNDSVLHVVTGNGLKDAGRLAATGGSFAVVDPDLGSVRRALADVN